MPRGGPFQNRLKLRSPKRRGRNRGIPQKDDSGTTEAAGFRQRRIVWGDAHLCVRLGVRISTVSQRRYPLQYGGIPKPMTKLRGAIGCQNTFWTILEIQRPVRKRSGRKMKVGCGAFPRLLRRLIFLPGGALSKNMRPSGRGEMQPIKSSRPHGGYHARNHSVECLNPLPTTQ